MVENDPRVKVKLFQVSAGELAGNGSVSAGHAARGAASAGSLSTIMASIAPLVGARRAAVQARSQARMAQVLQATAALVDEIGPEAVSTSSVAERAGVSVGWLYNYFDDREGLLEEILADGLRELDERLDAAGFSLVGPGWRATAAAGIDVVIDFMAGLPGFRSLWYSAEFSGRMTQVNRLHDDALAEYLAASMTHVRPDAPEVPLVVVAKVFVGMIDKGIDLSFRDAPAGDSALLAEMKRASIAYLDTFLV
jgi:AcrR family transcriptional regulator